MSFRALDEEIEVRTRMHEGSVDGVYRGNVGPQNAGPRNTGPDAGPGENACSSAGLRGPSEPYSACLFGTMPRTGIPSGPF